MSLAHISPREARTPSADFALKAAFLGLHGVGGPQRGGGLRGRVLGYSRQSRKRLTDLLNQIERAAVGSALFLTLTYPDSFPSDAAVWHRHLDRMLKRLARAYPTACVVWRLEMQVRKSGASVGRWAPHLHLLLLGVPRLSLEWLSRAWYEVVGSGDSRHLRAGTRAERVRSAGRISGYLWKYVGKPQAEGFEDWPTGRVWGVAGRGRLPRLLLRIPLSWAQFHRLRRVLRGWLERKTGRKWRSRMRGQGVSAYLAADVGGRLLAWSAATE